MSKVDFKDGTVQVDGELKLEFALQGYARPGGSAVKDLGKIYQQRREQDSNKIFDPVPEAPLQTL